MEATGSGALLRPIPVGIRRPPGDVGLLPARVKIGDVFNDEGHLRYYASARCGLKKEEKRRMKLVKGLEKDLSALYSMGFGVDKGEGMAGEVKGQIISEAAELLLAQLTKLRAEAKEMKKRRKQEKAAKKAAKMKDRMDSESSLSTSSESSDSECETVVKMSSLRSASDPMTEAALQAEDVAEEAKNNLSVNLEPQCCSSSSSSSSSSSEVVAVRPTDKRIEVCMGGKCKKSGAMELMAEFERKVAIEGAVVGCKCMGKCRDSPNVRVVNQSSVEDRLARAAKVPMCVGVGLEDVGSIVAEFLGEESKRGVALLAA